MVYGIYQSAAGMQVNQYRQAVLANNLANVSTAGFKPDVAVVRERMTATREEPADPDRSDATLAGISGGSLVAPTYTSMLAGPIEQTGKPLDVAIAGDGFFSVQDGKSQRYTRDGRFALNSDGELVTVAGRHPVLDDHGQPIVLPRVAASRARIDAGGEVRAGGTTYGRIGVVQFADQNGLRKVGGNMFQATAGQPEPLRAHLMVGAVEGSAVDPTQAMVSMIEVNRAYQLNATMVSLADSTLSRAVNDIARVR